MKSPRLLSMACGIILMIGTLVGCVAMPDGSTGPDYAAIELGSVIAMTVLVNEVDSSQDTKIDTYNALVDLHTTLSCVDTGRTDCPPYNLHLVPEMLANTLPVEYKALGPAIVSYAQAKVRLYWDAKVPEIENADLIRRATVAVLSGSIQALQPHVR